MMGLFDRFARRNAATPEAPEAPEAPATVDTVDGPMESPPAPAPPTTVTSREAAWMLGLVRDAFQAHGEQVTVVGTDLVGPTGTVWGIGNLLIMATPVPRVHWPQIADEHAKTMLAAHSTPPLTPADAGMLLPRLRRTSDLRSPSDYATECLPGVLALVAADRPTHVDEIPSSQSFQAIGTADEVQRIARQNLRRLPVLEHRVLSSDQERRTGSVHVFVGDDFFVPSRVLMLDELLSSAGVQQSPHGAFVAVPHRHLLAVHVVEGPDVVGAMSGLTNLARLQHAEGAGPISPDVFYIAADGRSQQLTHTDGERIALRVDGIIAETFVALGLPG